MAEEQAHTREDKFFGVKTTIGDMPNEAEAEKPEIEFEDDTDEVSEEAPKKADSERSSKDEDELSEYSENVQKRINRLTWEREEAKRQQEAIQKERDEAFRAAQVLNQQNQQYRQTIDQGEGYLVKQIKDRAALAFSAAQSKYRKAYEEGDTDAILAAQDEMLQAKFEANEAANYERDYQRRLAASQQRPQPQFPQAPPAMPQPQPQAVQHQVPKPTKLAQEWAEKNTWFHSAEHPDMTALAYGVHEDMIKNRGIRPDTEEYFNHLDQTMRHHFPEYFQQSGGSAGQPNPVVAPSARNNGARPKKVKLTQSQVALAKQLGLSPEQYAEQLIKGAV